MKLTSINLQGFETWEQRKSHIATYIQDEAPDILFFQEVVFLPEVSPYNQVQLLNQSLGYISEQTIVTRLQVGLHYPVYREGLGVLSRYPIVRSDAVSLTRAEGDQHQRFIQLVDILVDETIVKVAHVHFSITDVTDFATPHLQETLNILRERGETRIIVGDFNLTYLENSAELWQDEYIASTEVPYVTFPKMNKRVDYFLIPHAYQFDSIQVSDDSLSDHRALTVQISAAVTPAAIATSRTQSLVSHE